MAMVISKRRLQPDDFDSWKRRFEQGAEARKAAGCRGLRRCYSPSDPNLVFVIFDWDSHENARQFIESNQRAIEVRNPDAPKPDIETWYLDELTPLPS